MAEVGTKVGNAFMDLGYSNTGLVAISTAFDFARQLALCSAKFPCILPKESRVLDLDTVGQGEISP